MPDDGLRTRTIQERRIQIDSSGAWVSRDGNTITISYDYAGRLTKENQRFYADDIERLAAFVRETDPPGGRNA